MTEERFGQIIERAVEGAAYKLDASLNRAWKHKPVRFIGKTLASISGLGLMASSVHLSNKGNHTAAKICFISGGVVIASNVLELIIFKKK